MMAAAVLGILACSAGSIDAAAPVVKTRDAAQDHPLQLAEGGSLLGGEKKRHSKFFEQAPIDVRTPPPLEAHAGARVVLEFEFAPQDTIKVPIYPPAYLSDFSIYGDLKGPQGKVYARVLTPQEQEEGRLSYYEDGPPPAVRVELDIPVGTEPGSYPYSAQVHYFYCYESGGICAKEKTAIEGVIDIVKDSDK